MSLPYYESIFIARQDISPVQVDSLVDTFVKVLSNGGGKVTKKENWGLRTLAYKIKKNRKGHYVLMNVESSASAISEMENQMRLNEDILRFMTVKVEKLDEEPSYMMRNKDRDERSKKDDPMQEEVSDLNKLDDIMQTSNGGDKE